MGGVLLCFEGGQVSRPVFPLALEGPDQATGGVEVGRQLQNLGEGGFRRQVPPAQGFVDLPDQVLRQPAAGVFDEAGQVCFDLAHGRRVGLDLGEDAVGQGEKFFPLRVVVFDLPAQGQAVDMPAFSQGGEDQVGKATVSVEVEVGRPDLADDFDGDFRRRQTADKKGLFDDPDVGLVGFSGFDDQGVEGVSLVVHCVLSPYKKCAIIRGDRSFGVLSPFRPPRWLQTWAVVYSSTVRRASMNSSRSSGLTLTARPILTTFNSPSLTSRRIVASETCKRSQTSSRVRSRLSSGVVVIFWSCSFGA